EELSTINSGFLDRAREQGAPIDEINRSGAEVTRVGERLRLWHARHWELVGVELDVKAGILGHNGRAVALTPREAQLFGFLLAHPNRFSQPRLCRRALGAIRTWRKSRSEPMSAACAAGWRRLRSPDGWSASRGRAMRWFSTRAVGAQRAPASIAANTHWRSCGAGIAPLTRSTCLPPFSITSVGMPRTSKRSERIWLSSVLTLTTLSRPRRSRPICSTAGETIRHGPHQGAQKSTSTGSAESSTTPLNSASPAAVI